MKYKYDIELVCDNKIYYFIIYTMLLFYILRLKTSQFQNTSHYYRTHLLVLVESYVYH